MDNVELMKALKGVYSYIVQSEQLTWEDVYMRCYNVAQDILADSKPDTIIDDYSKMILNDIRSKKIKLTDEQKQEARNIFGEHWNRYFFGNITISNDGISLDSQWQEWADMYPGTFDASTNPNDMIGELYDIIGTLKETSERIVEYDNAEKARWLANEIYNGYWNISPIRTTADKYDKKIKLLNFKHRETMSEMRNEYKTRLDEQRKTDKAKHNELYKKLRERKQQEVALAKQKGRERLDTYKENAERKARIQSITATALTLNDMLKKNSKDKHIPDVMKDAVQELLTAINFSSKRLLEGGKPTMNDERLANALKNLNTEINNPETNIQDALIDLYSSELPKKLSGLVKTIDMYMKATKGQEFLLNAMKVNELKALDDILKIMRHAVNDVNKFHVAQHNAGVESLGIQSTEELGKRKKIYKDNKKHFDKLKTKTFWNNLNPYYAFKHMGESAQTIFRAFQDGQDKMAFLAKEVIEKTKEIYKAKEYKQWSKTFFDFEIVQPNGETKKFSMNVPQIMSLYCVAKQPDALRHLLHGDKNGKGGGITLVETSKTEAVLKNILLTKADLDNIISKLDDCKAQI